MKSFVKNATPQPVLRVLTPAYRLLKQPVKKTTALADAYGLIGPDEIYDESYYAKRRQDPWRSESNDVGRLLLEEFEPESVIDFGCAVGAFLEPFHNEGIRCHGIDGNSAAIENAVIPREMMTKHDLRTPFETEEKYDLGICIEVAEHIPERAADTLIRSICSATETVVFTAARPGQKGTHHVNLQPHSYWTEKFESYGLSLDEETTARLKDEIEAERMDWIEENLLVFQRN